MKISVLGSGCPTCKKLHLAVEKVVKVEKIDAEVEYSTDIKRIVELGIMMSPVLVVDGKPVNLRSTSEKDVKSALCGAISKDKDCCKDENSEAKSGGCSCGGNC
jgi:small redox-active disulfide protein 2